MRNYLKTIWIAAVLLFSFQYTLCSQVLHPHILVNPEDRSKVLDKIAKQKWAESIFTGFSERITPYVERHKSDPEWILSRYLMNRVPGKRYTRAISDGRGMQLIRHEGDAPVPTVRVSPHIRGPVTPSGASYRRPSIEELIPYDTARLMNLVNTETNQKELINPQAFVGDINGEINSLAFNAALVYWLKGDESYAKFAADILDQWAKGASYQEPIIGPCRTGYLDMQTLGDQAHRALILAYDFVYPYMKTKGYDLKYYEPVFEKFASTLAFRGFWNNNWYAAESSTMVFAALSLENTVKRDYYLQFFLTKDTTNVGCGQLALPSTVEKWLTHDGHWKEPGGYHNYPVSNLLISSLALENNGYNIFRKFPALFRASYAMLKYSFPNLTVSAFGDTGRASQSAESLEIGILGAVKYNQPELTEMIASMNKLVEGGRYRRENSGYLGLLCFLPDLPSGKSVYSWPRGGTLEFARFFLQRNGTDPRFGLMYGVQGASYNHNHCNGMAMELYGMGEVMGIDAGAGPTYEHPLHVNYYSQWAAHNTVAAAGASSSVPVSGSAGRKDIGQIELAAMEPMPDEGAVSPICSFTDTRYYDKSTKTNQMRTMAIVRTSDKSGYYVDIYRSDNPKSNDYIYHNIGDDITFLDGSRKPLKTDSTSYPLTGKDYPGFRFFTGVRKLTGWSDNLIALFSAKDEASEDIFMQVLMPGRKGREYYQGWSLRTRTSGRQYSGKSLPVFTMRDKGESLNNPFIAVFEPYKGKYGYNVQKISFDQRDDGSGFTTLTVHNQDLSKQVILQALDPGKTYKSPDWSFSGYFGIAGLENGKFSYLYLGKGREISYGGYTMRSADSTGSVSFSTEGNIYKVSCNQETEIELPVRDFQRGVLAEGTRETEIKISEVNGKISFKIPAVHNAEIRLVSKRGKSDRLSWQEIRTVDDVCAAYPERITFLMRNLNLDIDGLKEVRNAYLDGNISLACKNLLDYYIKGNSAGYLRKNPAGKTDKRNSVADSVLQDIYSFYNQPDKISRDADGHLNWKYHGPADDIEWAWALNRHYHLRVLLDAWLETGNPDYSKAMDLHIKDWLISSLPYPERKSGTELWRGLEVSFRVKIWARIFYNLINNEDLTPATRLLMLASLPEHAHYARNFHAQGNWLTMEMSGLATVATAWKEFNDSPAWLAYTKETMTKSLMEQVYPDGVQTELTSSYHQVALDNFNQFRETLLQANEPLPEIFEEQIEKMWNYIAYTMRPDGYGLLNNDADLIYNRDRIIRAAEAFNRKDWLYIATNGKEGVRPAGEPSNFFPYAGHLTMRSGYEPEAQWAFFDIGPWGSGHQHSDKLHISVAAYGQDLLVDGGRFAYRGEVADKFRRYATGSYSHNVILIDGKGQAAGPTVTKEPLSENHYKITKDFDYASDSFDRFIDTEGQCRHTRSVIYVRENFWVVVDRIETDRPRKIETMWHWHPSCNIKTEKKSIISTDNSRGNLKIIPVGSQAWTVSQVKGQEQPVPQGWYSREYNSAVPSTVNIYSGDISGNSTFIWILYPYKSEPQAVKAKIISSDDNGVRLNVKVSGSGQWDIVVPFKESGKAYVKKGK